MKFFFMFCGFIFILFLFNVYYLNSSTIDPKNILNIDNVYVNVKVYKKSGLSKLYYKKDYSKIIAIYSKSLNSNELDYNDFADKFLIAMSYFRLDKFSNSANLFEDILYEKHNIKEWILYHLAMSFYFSGNYKKTLKYIDLFHLSYKFSPFLPKLISIEANILIKQKKYKELYSNFVNYSKYFKENINTLKDKYKKTYFNILYYISYADELLGNLEKAFLSYANLLEHTDIAKKFVNRMISIKKDFLKFLNKKQIVYLSYYYVSVLGDYQKALDLIEKVNFNRLNKSSFMKLKVLSFSYENLNKKDLVLKSYYDFFKKFENIKSSNLKIYQNVEYNYIKYLNKIDKEKAKSLFYKILNFNNHYFLKDSIDNFKDLISISDSTDFLSLYILRSIELQKYRLVDKILFQLINNQKYEYLIDLLKFILNNTKDKWICPKLNYWIARSLEKLGKKDQAFSYYKKGFLSYKKSYYTYLCFNSIKKTLQNNSNNKINNFHSNLKFVSIASKDKMLFNKFINSKPFQNRLKTIKKHHNFEKNQNYLFNQAFQLMSLGEIVGGYKSFLRYLESLKDKGESKYSYYLIFIKLFRKLGINHLSIRYSDFLMSYLNSSQSANYILPYLDKTSYPLFFKKEILKISKKYSVDPYLIFALIREESRFNSMATSRSGAIGLMQLMPKTAFYLIKLLKNKDSIKVKNKKEFYNYKINILLGTKYISHLLSKMPIKLTLASYNGGPTRFTKLYKKTNKNENLLGYDHFIELIEINETRRYVKKVLLSYYLYNKIFTTL